MTQPIRIIGVAIVAMLLGGCVTSGSTPTAVCDALVGPIRYTSTNKASARYAGKALAPDLAVRNRVGMNLKCKAYR